MKKKALVAILFFCLILPIDILSNFDGVIEETRNLLVTFEVQNANLVEMLDFVLAIKNQGLETYIKCIACKILLEEERILISQSQKILSDVEEAITDVKKDRSPGPKEEFNQKKEIEDKLVEIRQKMGKILVIHRRVISFVNERFEFLLNEAEKTKSTPI